MRITQEEADALGRKSGAAMRKGSRQAGDEVRKRPRRQASSGGAGRKEREIQAAILAYLRTVPGVVAWRNNVAAVKTGERFIRFGFKGLSDIVGWVSSPGEHVALFMAIEVKTEKTYPTAEQQHFLEFVHAAGGISIVARSVEDVRRVLQP